MPGGRPRHEFSRLFTITKDKVNQNDTYCYCNQCYKEALNTMDEMTAYTLLGFLNSKANCEKYLKKC